MPDATVLSMADATTILSVDPGKKKTGVALGNRITNTARPLATVRGGLEAQVKQLATLCEQWQADALIIGMPDKALARDANRYCMRMAVAMREATALRIAFCDEAYTTQASRAAARAEPGHGVDAHAAAMIAEDWLAQNPA